MKQNNLLPLYLQAAFAKKLTMYYMTIMQILPIIGVVVLTLFVYFTSNIIATIIALYIFSGLVSIYLGYIIIFKDEYTINATLRFINNIVFQYSKEQEKILLFIIQYTESDDIYPDIFPAIRNAFYLKNNELTLVVLQYLFKSIICKSKNININLFTKEK